MALDYTTPAEALSESTTLFDGLIPGLPAIPAFPPLLAVDMPAVPDIPIDLETEIVQPTVEELTQGAVAGSGVFDKIMSSNGSHIEAQYLKQIIGKSDVASIYIAAIQAVMPQAIQFLLEKDKSFWAAKLVQIQAQNASLERTRLIAEIETAKLVAHRAHAEAYTAQVSAYIAQSQYANSKLQLTKVLQEINTLEARQALDEEAFNEAWLKTHTTMPSGGAAGGHAQKDFLLKDAALVTAQKQQDLLTAQTNVQRAQTYDTNTDTTPVAGIMGVQKALYTQQIQSYKDDGQNKAVKVVADLWTSAKALDDATQSPGPLAGNLILSMNKYLNNLGLPHAYNNPDTPATGAPSADADPYTPGDQ